MESADSSLQTLEAPGSFPTLSRRRGTLTARGPALVEFLDCSHVKAKGYLQPCSFGWSSAVAEGGRSLAHGDSRKKPHTAPPFMTLQGMAADPRVRGFPLMAIYRQRAYASHVSTCCRPLRASATLEPLAAFGRMTVGHDDSNLLDCPHHVSWIGPALKVLTDGHPDGHFF